MIKNMPGDKQMKKLIRSFSLLLILVLIVLSFMFRANAQEKPKNWSLNGYVKDMQTIIFTDIDDPWITDNLIHNRLNFKWYPTKSITLKIEMRNRFIWGELLSNPLYNYADYVDVEMGFMDLSDNLIKEKSFILHSTIDRAYLDFVRGDWQLRVGRQRINWAQTFAFNPNDVFNTYSFFDFDYEEKPGSDAVQLIYYPNFTSQVELAVKADYKDRVTAAARYKFNKWGYDLQFLGGMLNETDYLIGAGWSGSILKGGFRSEISYFHPKNDFADTSGALIATLGYDYTFKNSLFLQAEVLYNGNYENLGGFNFMDLMTMELSPKNIFPAEWVFVLNASYPVTPLLNTTLAAMYSPEENIVFVGPNISWSLSENTDFSFVVQYFTSDLPKKMGGEGTNVFLRFKQSF